MYMGLGESTTTGEDGQDDSSGLTSIGLASLEAWLEVDAMD